MSREESIEGPLTALRNAGTVCGVCLARETEVVVNLFPFSQNRIEEMVSVVADILVFFDDQERNVDQMCFGYDGGNLVIVTDGPYRLVVMHMLGDEVDFIAKAARAFLVDFQMGLFAEQLIGKNARLTDLNPGGVTIETADKPAPAPVPAPDASPIKPRVAADQMAPASAPAPQTSVEVESPIPVVPGPRPMAPVASNASTVQPDGVESARGARLAPQQPESTLPPPRRPKARTD